jgi:hypothetical protein
MMSVIGLTFLPHGSVVTITLQLAPSLRPLVLSSSLLRCESVQVYYRHHPFGQCGQRFGEWSMLLHLRLLLCMQFFSFISEGADLHNVLKFSVA